MGTVFSPIFYSDSSFRLVKGQTILSLLKIISGRSYDVRGGMKPAGLGRERDEELNAALEALTKRLSAACSEH
jgi:hypothetical protein